MTVSGGLGPALTARRWWCRPDEPILWAVWQSEPGYRVKGRDERGVPKASIGTKISRGIGKAASEAGPAALYVIGTALFGGGEDSGKFNSKRGIAGLTIVGGEKDCAAVQLFDSNVPLGAQYLPSLWVLTPTRLGVLAAKFEPAPKRTPAPVASDGLGGHIQQLGRGWGDVGRVLVGSTPEKFGGNEPGAPVRGPEALPWFEIPRTDIAECNVVGPKGKEDEWRHCGVQLADGSAFVLNGKTPADARYMVEMVRGGGGRG